MINTIIELSAEPVGFHDVADELTADMFVSSIPTQHSHDYYCDEELGLYIGVWDTTDMQEAPGAYELEEFMVILVGEASIKNNQTGHIETVQAGESFVIPKGYDCQWQQQGYLKKFYVILDNDKLAANNQNVNSIAHFSANQNNESYENEQHTLKAGVSNTNDNLNCSKDYRFVSVLKGRLTLTDSSENNQSFGENATIFIKKGQVVSSSISADYKQYFANISI
ncbi:cupin domain-containing protein [Thalassotalea fonticola]|uniref:Cupin domain-containing protein n=1 Tax=Thalassotalea fonticola TaxID=3065649 RepID=A0ABZ0GLX8_9GAMM|nr:cupin domain-containing protein [Colwelliaceae bacterium S1-1]